MTLYFAAARMRGIDAARATEQDRPESRLCAQTEDAPGYVPSLLAFDPTPPWALREGRTWPARPPMTKEPSRYWLSASVVTRLRQISSRVRERRWHNEQQTCSHGEV